MFRSSSAVRYQEGDPKRKLRRRYHLNREVDGFGDCGWGLFKSRHWLPKQGLSGPRLLDFRLDPFIFRGPRNRGLENF